MSSAITGPGSQSEAYPILNPWTPMVYLEPHVARQVALARYIVITSLAILIWDILSNISADSRLLSRYRIRLPTLVYFFSRLTSLVYVLWYSIYYTAPIGNCNQNQRGLTTFYPAAVSASTMLFFFRMRIVYDGHRLLICLFFTLWLSVVGGTLTAVFGLTGDSIGPTNYCLVSGIEAYVSASVILPLVYDTAVFVAVTYRLAGHPYLDSSNDGAIWRMLAGSYLPGVSKALLKDGQSYYAVTVLSNLLAVVMIFVTTAPVAYRTIFSAPNLVLINTMACRVYRNMKFGVFEEAAFTTSNLLPTNLSTARKAPSILPVVFRHTHTATDNGDCHTDCTHQVSNRSTSNLGHGRATVNASASGGLTAGPTSVRPHGVTVQDIAEVDIYQKSYDLADQIGAARSALQVAGHHFPYPPLTHLGITDSVC